VQVPVGGHKSPNPTEKAVFFRRQWGVRTPLVEPSKLLHPSLVEKQGAARPDL